MKSKNADLWVVETNLLYRVPVVKKYTGRPHKKGAMVSVRGFEKYMPPAIGRRFFVLRTHAEAYCRGWMEEKLSRLRSDADWLNTILVRPGSILEAIHAETVPDSQPPHRPIKLK